MLSGSNLLNYLWMRMIGTFESFSLESSTILIFGVGVKHNLITYTALASWFIQQNSFLIDIQQQLLRNLSCPIMLTYPVIIVVNSKIWKPDRHMLKCCTISSSLRTDRAAIKRSILKWNHFMDEISTYAIRDSHDYLEIK